MVKTELVETNEDYTRGPAESGCGGETGRMAVLQSRWPRHGLGESNVVHGRRLGRFASMDDRWMFETSQGTLSHQGQGNPLSHLDRILRSMEPQHPNAGAIGYIAYEAGYNWMGMEPSAADAGTFPMPQTQFLVFDSVRAEKPKLRPRPMDPKRSAYSDAHLSALAGSSRVHAMTDRRCYLDAVGRIKNHIRDGDIYQANYTQAFDIVTAREGLEIYEDLAAANPAPFAAYMRFPPLHWDLDGGSVFEFPGLEIISNSPERFWKKSGPQVETRPIKGTIARGESQTADQENRRQLLLSPKDRAELLMITDLERNDLGKLAKIGSVKVQALRRVRECPSIWHLESVVTALVDPEIKWYHLMHLMFPGGSITGAPKRRAMEILRSLEPVPRGVYCGAIGWMTANGDADFSIAIRTLVKIGKNVRVHCGGGIVADSDPMSEYRESLIKIAPILECLCR